MKLYKAVGQKFSSNHSDVVVKRFLHMREAPLDVKLVGNVVAHRVAVGCTVKLKLLDGVGAYCSFEVDAGSGTDQGEQGVNDEVGCWDSGQTC